MLAEIWRYPVKSMGGERLQEVNVTEHGLEHDRSWAVVDDETGLVASAKHPQRWRGLLRLTSTAINGDEVHVQWHDGVRSDPLPFELDARLTEHLGRNVVLTRSGDVVSRTVTRTDPEPEALRTSAIPALSSPQTFELGAASPHGTLFDFAPIHLMSTATLETIEHGAGKGAGDPRRFRPNLVIDLDGPGFQEAAWVGKHLRFDGGLVLKVTIQSPRCIVPTLAQPSLPRNIEALKTVARHNRADLDELGIHSCAGAYASVVAEGTIRRGANVTLIR